MDFLQLSTLLDGQLIQLAEPRPVGTLLTDSRKLLPAYDAVFFALKGPRHDGHQFLSEAYAQGVRQFVVEHLPEHVLPSDCNVLLVPHTLAALQTLAAHHRAQFQIPVIGLTGSNGKTIVKEWLHTILNKKYAITKNPKSYNSQLGVALSVWQLQPTDTLGIFEAGISTTGEMNALARIIAPTLGIFTNIGTAHAEGFSDQKEKIQEKARLFATCQTIVCSGNHPAVVAELASLYPKKQLFTWGNGPDNNVQVTEIHLAHQNARIYMRFQERHLQFQVPFADDASLENILHVIATALYLGLEPTEIADRILLIKPISMRLELKQALHQCYLVDDTYTNDLAGLRVAIEFLLQQEHGESITLILSEIPQSGLPTQELHRLMADLLRHPRIQRLIAVGPSLADTPAFPVKECLYFSTTEELLEALPGIPFHKELLLVKGARVYGFERVVNQLVKKVHGTRLEINLNAITHNLNYYKSLLAPSTKIMAMVKAFAYGSGSAEIANLLQFHRVDYLGVAYADEGVALREQGIHLPIMVMNPSPDGFDKMLTHQLEPEIYSISLLKNYLENLGNQKGKIHLKIDTGMHRLGFELADLPELLSLLKAHPHVEIVSMFSHLAGADDPTHNVFSHQQAAQFLEISSAISPTLGSFPLLHLLNSAGIVRFPEYHFDMVRLGIGLYGVEASGLDVNALQPVSTLRTVVSQVRILPAGESIGYGRQGKAKNEMRLATIAIGYGDGFSRAFSNGKGEVLIGSYRAPVVGNVCMDMTMVDVTGLPVQEGDEVIVFGKDLPIQELANRIGTIPYEILTNVSERVKRVFFFD
jgi:Alr-MurF fusion protein